MIDTKRSPKDSFVLVVRLSTLTFIDLWSFRIKKTEIYTLLYLMKEKLVMKTCSNVTQKMTKLMADLCTLLLILLGA